MDPVKALQEIGWSELEARVYVALWESGTDLSGYQVAKAAHIARANVYPVLERLIRRGAVQEYPATEGSRYRAVAFTTIADAQMAIWSERMANLKEALAKPLTPPRVAVARGVEAGLAHGFRVIQEASRTLDIGASYGSVRPFANVLAEARQRGVKERFLCFDRCPPPGCGVCQDPIMVGTGPFRSTGWLLLVRDKEDALIASGTDEKREILLTDLAPIQETVQLLLTLGEERALQIRPE